MKNAKNTIVLIPFIADKRLMAAMSCCESQLTENERNSNCQGPLKIFHFCEEDLGKFNFLDCNDIITNCINVFAGKNHCVCEERLEYNIPRDQLLKGLHPNYNPDRFILGFPSLQSKTKVVLIFKLFRIWSQIVMVHQIGKLAEKEQANKNSG